MLEVQSNLKTLGFRPWGTWLAPQKHVPTNKYYRAKFGRSRSKGMNVFTEIGR